ncbi:hypothetical protein [Caulobacter segnis]
MTITPDRLRAETSHGEPIRTLRDEFAMAAITGLVTMSHDAGGFALDADKRAKAAYRHADAMMKARGQN